MIPNALLEASTLALLFRLTSHSDRVTHSQPIGNAPANIILGFSPSLIDVVAGE